MNRSELYDHDIEVPARDGYPLRATVYRAAEAHTRVVIISGATAIPRRFYRHYAAALAAAGYTAVTYDYRGIGDSRQGSLRGFEARMRDWGLLDMAGVVDWVASDLCATRLFMIGHSVGGQVTGLLDNGAKIDGMMTLSAQSGHWRLQGGRQVWATAFHVHVTLPLLSSAFGYMPWSWLGAGEDLPKGVAIEWAGWCRNRDYLLGDHTLPLDRFAGFDAPILAYSIDDDDWGTPRAVDAMMSAYPNVERRHIVPRDWNLRSIGHVGYFRPQARALWDEGIAWLDRIR